jgi:hypothetical protein
LFQLLKIIGEPEYSLIPGRRASAFLAFHTAFQQTGKRLGADPDSCLSRRGLLHSREEDVMSDGHEEREEREKRREQEEREDREDRLEREPVNEWQPERVDS